MYAFITIFILMVRKVSMCLIYQGSSLYTVLLGTDGHGSQEPRVQMVRGYRFHIIAVGTSVVPEKLGLLRSGLRSLVKSAVWLRSGLRNSRLSLRVGSRPVCTQNIFSRTAASPMPSTLGKHLPLRTNSFTFLHLLSSQQPPLVLIAHPRGIDCVFIAAQQ